MGKDNKIFKARKAAGLSRADTAKELKIPVRTIEDWEAEKRTPPEYVEVLVIEKLQRISMKKKAKAGVREEISIFDLENMDYFDGKEWLAAHGYKLDHIFEDGSQGDGMIYVSEYYKVVFQPEDFDYTEGEDEAYNSSTISWEYAIPGDAEETIDLKCDNGYWHEVSASGPV